MSYFKRTIDGEVGTLEFDTPDSSVNILCSAAVTELDQHLDEIANCADIKVLLFTSAKKSIFIAGADIKEIDSITNPQEAIEKCNRGKEVLNKLESLPQITVAVINGACLGGGYELSLACDYRVAGFAGHVKIGLPEVRLGILPGFGGCIRLPELIGIANALTLILPGKILDSTRALKLGLVDRLFYDPILTDQAKTFARKTLSKKETVHRRRKPFMSKLLEENPVGRSILFHKARKNILKSTSGHYPAPLVALDTIKSLVGKSREEAFRLESEGFGKLGASEISKNLIHVFYLDEHYKKKQWTDVKPAASQIKKVGVIGAGVMGGGIAQLLAKNNIICRIKDLNNKALALALKTARNVYNYLLKTGRLKKGQVEAQMSLISPTTTYQGFKNTDVVIEAVVERLDIKKQVFKELDEIVQPDACLFTNTSSLSVTEMAKSTNRPDKVCGFHFFNPVHRMPLLEIITTDKTSQETLATAVTFARQLGKMVIVVKDKEGFVVNRILLPYMNEAAYLFQEGIDTKRLDQIVKKFGIPMGPLELADEVGIDVGYHVAQILEATYGKRMCVADILKKTYAAGTLGKKSGEGFYAYRGKQKKVSSKPRSMCGPATFTIDDNTTIKRLIYVMINEASRCLEEGVVESASTIDVGMIYGTGFPPFRGGLLRYADSVGVKRIVADLQKFQTRFDQYRFEPSGLLRSMAETGESFYPP